MMMITESPTISEVFHGSVEMSPASGRAALERIELLEPLVEGLAAMGLERRLVWFGPIEAEPRGDRYAVGLIWDFDDVPQASAPAGADEFAAYSEPGVAKFMWDVAIGPSADGDSVATIGFGAWATDPVAEERLLDVWPVVGPVAEQHARRMLNALKAYADELAESGNLAEAA